MSVICSYIQSTSERASSVVWGFSVQTQAFLGSVRFWTWALSRVCAKFLPLISKSSLGLSSDWRVKLKEQLSRSITLLFWLSKQSNEGRQMDEVSFFSRSADLASASIFWREAKNNETRLCFSVILQRACLFIRAGSIFQLLIELLWYRLKALALITCQLQQIST